MFVTIVIIAVIAFVVYLIKSRNLFVELVSDIDNCKSQVNTAKAKYLDVQQKALGLAGKAQKNDGSEYQNIRNANGTISSNTLLSLGQMYPDLKDKFASAARLSEQLYNDYRNAQTQLNHAITEYTKTIAVFPRNIAAYICGYEKEDLIDQENLERSKELNMASELDFTNYL